MKVIVAGASKTGTTSITFALKTLGFNVYSYLDNFFNLRDEREKIYSVGGTTQDFYEMFKDVDAVVDIPCFHFWDEIHKAFSDAKIILTMRDDEESWSKSLEKQLQVESTPFFHCMTFFSPTFRKFQNFHVKTITTIFGTYPHFNFFTLFKGPQINMTLFCKAYRRNNAHILQAASKDKLLIYNVKEGWKPLCKFLETEIPDQPFPHENIAGEETAKRLRSHPYFKRCVHETIFVMFLLSLCTGFGIYKFVKYRHSIFLLDASSFTVFKLSQLQPLYY